jgi:lycopene beta-cyclase
MDVLIVGGGLAGSLTALKFAVARPNTRVLLFESSDRLGAGHTWRFHESDIPADSLSWIKPLISKTWTESSVQFPRLQRTFNGNYHMIRSDDLHRVVKEQLGPNLRLKAKVERASDVQVVLENGDTFQGLCVIDARGLENLPPVKINGFMKSIAYDFRLEEPHGLTAPLLADATCPQLDGYRYFAVLPLDEKRVIVQECFYSDESELNSDRISRSARAYAERRGWKIAEVERQEAATLPIPMVSEYLKTSLTGEPLPIGARGGYFHAATGVVLPDAVQMADFLAGLQELGTQSAREALMKHRRSWVSRQRFYRMLNRFVFYAAEPTLRYQVMQHFYELPLDLLERFRGGRTTWSDRLRILGGRPPVPFDRALRSLTERSVQSRVQGTAK